MITNIIEQDFSTFKAKIFDVGERIETLADFYTARISNNETGLIEKYAKQILDRNTGHFIDPRIYLRQNLLALVQNSYALGIADGLTDLQDVQFSNKKTTADFATDPNDKLQKDIQKLQRDIIQSQQIVRQTKTLNQYTNTLQALQRQAQTLQNTQAIQTLNQLAQELQTLKTNNTVRSVGRIVNQQIQKGGTQQQQAQTIVNQQIAATGLPNTQDYLIKRAIEEKLQYLQNRKSSLEETPPIVLEEDSEFFKWYAQKRLIPIANRYQEKLVNNNKEVKNIITEYTEKLNNGSITQASKGEYTDKIVKKLLNIEDSSEDKYIKKAQQNAKKTGVYVDPYKKEPLRTRPIKRVQRVVSTELAIAYNIGRLKTYMKAGIQYVTISTSAYSPRVCSYCIDTERKSESQPISIASLLKRAYKNEGFDKDLKRPIENRYLPNHPYCYCFYKPHPKQDNTEQSTGIYSDPNSWKFVLGAGLGVSLAFLAFALTTGRKIQIPSVIPNNLPVRQPQTLPEVITNVVPETIPVRAIQPSELIPLPLLQRSIQNLTKEQQSVYADIISDTTLPIDIRLAQVYAQAADDNIVVNTKDFMTLEAEATQVIATKGVVRAFINKQVDRIQQTYDRNIQPLTTRIAQEQARTELIDPNNPSKTTIAGITNSLKNINKTYIQSQLKSIQTTKRIALESYDKVANKTKASDLQYKEELQEKINILSSMENSLLEQRGIIGNIQEYISDLVIPTKSVLRKTNKAIIEQQLANTTAIVDNLIDGSRLTTIVDRTVQVTRLQQAEEEYQKLLELLVNLSPTEYKPYKKRIQELNRRIKNAQGIQLKRFTGNIVNFKYS